MIHHLPILHTTSWQLHCKNMCLQSHVRIRQSFQKSHFSKCKAQAQHIQRKQNIRSNMHIIYQNKNTHSSQIPRCLFFRLSKFLRNEYEYACHNINLKLLCTIENQTPNPIYSITMKYKSLLLRTGECIVSEIQVNSWYSGKVEMGKKSLVCFGRQEKHTNLGSCDGTQYCNYTG